MQEEFKFVTADEDDNNNDDDHNEDGAETFTKS